MSEDTNRTDPTPSVDRLSLLWRRTNDHKLVQWSVAYVAVAYGVQHAVTLTSEAFDWPRAVERISMLLLALGLPLVMTLAWYHGARASRRISGPELTIISILLVMSSLLFFVFVRPSAEVAAAPSRVVNVQSAALAGTGTLTGPAGISVAVLPFLNLSSDKEQEFFSDGMTEEITSALAKVPGLNVVARTSAFQFKGENKDVRAIGRALGASHLIEGSVRKDGNEVRITAQLVRADTGAHLWTESYDRELKGVFAVQEDIAKAIATALRVPLGLKEGQNLVSNRTSDTDSYQDYLRAKALVRGRGLKPLTDAAALLEKAVARDSHYAPAWALLAEAYLLIPDYDPRAFSGPAADLHRLADSLLPKAEAAARRAIQLDAKLADGYSVLAAVQHAHSKPLLADDLYRQALALDSSNPDTIHFYSLLRSESGYVKEALAMRQRLRVLEPFVPVFNWNYAVELWLNGQNEAAISILKELPQDAPIFGRVSLATVYASMGRFGDAAGILNTITETLPPGIVEAATRLLRTAPSKAASPQTLPRLDILGWVYLDVGAPERVLDYYERNIEAGFNFGLSDANLWHASFAPIRKTERFKTLVRKAGYVEYWRAKGWPDLCRPMGADDFVCD